MCCGIFSLFGRVIDQQCRVVHRRHEFAEFFDREIEGISNGTRNVFRDRCLHRQVTVSQATHLIKQTQNRRLIAFVLFPLLPGCLFEYRAFRMQKKQTRNQQQRQQYGANGEPQYFQKLRQKSFLPGGPKGRAKQHS